MIIGPKMSTNLFNFYKEDYSFSQEASSLCRPNNNFFGRLYDDSSDEGFVLVSHHTGQEVPFYLASIDKSDEGEIQCWNFKSASPYMLLKDMTVTVFND